MTEISTRTTGNEPADGVDPGGTRPAPASGRQKEVAQPVQSGDRNDYKESEKLPPVESDDKHTP